MERRSERLAKLLREKPISYRETAVKRVFKKICRRRTSVQEKQECQTRTESCLQRDGGSKSSDLENQPCYRSAFGSRWPRSANVCHVSQLGPVFGNQRSRSAYFWPVFQSEGLQPRCKSSPGIFEEPLMTQNAVSKRSSGKVGAFSATLVLVKMPAGPVKRSRSIMMERLPILLQGFMVLVLFLGFLKMLCSLSDVFYTQSRNENEALQYLEKEIFAVQRQLAVRQSLVDALTELSEETENFYMQMYSSDATNGYILQKDFALKSEGASVIESNQSYPGGTKVCMQSFCWECTQSPEVILERDNSPGNCWAMNGSKGYVIIKLSEEIYPTNVILDHLSRKISHTEKISCAPKDFSVHGMKYDGSEFTFLGLFSYRIDGFRMQAFRLKANNSEKFKYLLIRILSNWGHPNYTCIYGIRVNGEESG